MRATDKCFICGGKCEDKNKFASYCSRKCKNIADLKSYHKHKEKRKIYTKEYRKRNPEYVNKQVISSKKWRENNPNYMNNWTLNKLKTDINFKIKHHFRERIRIALKQNSKGAKTAELLGCSVEEFKNYLQSLFKEGMSWDNYGLMGWHIDHIKPCALFDLSKLEEQQKCFHYTNMQPLWAKDNLSKGKKYDKK